MPILTTTWLLHVELEATAASDGIAVGEREAGIDAARSLLGEKTLSDDSVISLTALASG
jgi:hypothetical protein